MKLLYVNGMWISVLNRRAPVFAVLSNGQGWPWSICYVSKTGPWFWCLHHFNPVSFASGRTQRLNLTNSQQPGNCGGCFGRNSQSTKILGEIVFYFFLIQMKASQNNQWNILMYALYLLHRAKIANSGRISQLLMQPDSVISVEIIISQLQASFREETILSQLHSSKATASNSAFS